MPSDLLVVDDLANRIASFVMVCMNDGVPVNGT